MPLSILHVGAFPFPGPTGDAAHLRAVSRGLAEAGHRVAVACFHAGSGAAPREVDLIRGPRLPRARAAQLALLARAVARVLRRRPVDVVHAHGLASAAVARLARGGAGGPPIVLDRPGSADGLVARFGRAGVDVAVAATAEEAARLRGSGWSEVRVVRPGVDALAVASGRAARARERWGLGAGAWIVQLGPAPWLAGAIAGSAVAGVLVVAGDPPVVPGVVVHRVGPAEVADALAAAALAVTGAADRGFPVEILAAMAAGLPVATDGDVGLPGVVAPDAIAGLLREPDRAAALGAAARAEIAARHGTAQHAAALEALYAERLGR